MLLYILDLIGVAVFAASGALAGMAANLDLLGVLVLAAITAVGGGTLRDVFLNRYPIFWIKDVLPLYTILGATVLTLTRARFFPIPTDTLLVADALGLALFAISVRRTERKPGVVTPCDGLHEFNPSRRATQRLIRALTHRIRDALPIAEPPLTPRVRHVFAIAPPLT
jgi:hypothetical protein